MLHELTMKNLRHFDMGRLEACFNAEVKAANADCIDRPGVNKRRTVAIVFEFTPSQDQSGSCELVNVVGKVKGTRPAYGTLEHSCDVRQGGLLFNGVDPMAPDQKTLEDALAAEDGDDDDDDD